MAALLATTGFGVWAMEQEEPVAPSTVTVTVQTDDGSSFKLNGRVIPSDATPDTVTVEIWKNGTKKAYYFTAIADTFAVSVHDRPVWLHKGVRIVPDSK